MTISTNSKTILNNVPYNRILKDSDLFRCLYSIISCVSPTDMPVMIFGETGTWKPLFAKLIHYHSPRKRGKFIVVDITDSNKSSLENEIFGHDYGDFNNPKLRKIGKIEQANGGSILLNEIGGISSGIQSRLLEIIQHQEFYRIGGNKTIPIDVRIIATANENLELDVKEGRFCEDLYYRMAVFPITIPPLRESKHDIELFAKRIIEIIAKKLEKPINGISGEAIKTLLDYHWPRNFSELEEVIEYAVDLETSSKIQKSSLPEALLNGKKHKPFFLSKKYYINTDRILPLDEIERQALIHAMRVTGNNVQLAAKALGINRATVYRKLDKYHLLRE